MRQHFFVSMLPMIGFGFMDNIVMIQAGDLIDNTIGVRFGLATLTAAAFGQVFSDVSGVAFGGVVDAFFAKLGVDPPAMTTAQRALPVVKRVGTVGSICGVITGCLLGMTSLFFMDLEAAEREKRAAELETIFKTIMHDGHQLVGAERCSLFIYDREANEVWSQVATGLSGAKGAKSVIRVPADKGFVGACVGSKEIVNVPDAYEDPRHNRDVDAKTNFRTREVLCVPVFHAETGEVQAVVQMINRTGGGAFDTNDEKLCRMLAQHVSIFLEDAGV